MKKTRKKPKLLVVDDQAVFLLQAEAYLSQWFDVSTAIDKTTALKRVEETKNQGHNFDCVLLDIVLKDDDGEQLAKILAEKNPGMAIILWTAYDRHDLAGLDRGIIDGVQSKESSLEVLKRAISHALWARNTSGRMVKNKLSSIRAMAGRSTTRAVLEEGETREAVRIDVILDKGEATTFGVYCDPDLDPNRIVVCAASTVGCIGECSGCVSGTRDLERGLSINELLAQVSIGLQTSLAKPVLSGKATCAVNFCREGEPMSNLKNVCGAIAILSKMRGLKTEFVITTIGLRKYIKEFLAKYWHLPVIFYLSVNYTTDEMRWEYMPILRKTRQTLAESRNLAIQLALATNNSVTISQFIIAGLNDTEEDAMRMWKLFGNPKFYGGSLLRFSDGRPIFKFKIQPQLRGNARLTSISQLEAYKAKLLAAGFSESQVRIRTIPGFEVGACGTAEPRGRWRP